MCHRATGSAHDRRATATNLTAGEQLAFSSTASLPLPPCPTTEMFLSHASSKANPCAPGSKFLTTADTATKSKPTPPRRINWIAFRRFNVDALLEDTRAEPPAAKSVAISPIRTGPSAEPRTVTGFESLTGDPDSMSEGSDSGPNDPTTRRKFKE